MYSDIFSSVAKNGKQKQQSDWTERNKLTLKKREESSSRFFVGFWESQ
jgi:hypothetical protein